jgi:hypothetical protein
MLLRAFRPQSEGRRVEGAESSHRSALRHQTDDPATLTGRNGHNSETLLQRAQDQIADLPLTAFVGPALAAVVQDEAGEVAEAIEQHLADLAGELPEVLLAWPKDGHVCWEIAEARRRDGVRIASQAVHTSGDLADVAQKHGIPAVGPGQRFEASLQDGEGGLQAGSIALLVETGIFTWKEPTM